MHKSCLCEKYLCTKGCFQAMACDHSEIIYLYELSEPQDNCLGPPECSGSGPIYLITCHFKFSGF